MILEYCNANSLLMDTFPEMQEAYYNNMDEYVDLPYAFYESEFVPFIMSRLRQNSLSDLKKIFGFIETLFADGDGMVIHLAGVAIVESLFFESEYEKYKNVILDLCGEKTHKSFEACFAG